MKALIDKLKGKRILILGFGREGKSTLKLLQRLIPSTSITICDKNPDAFKFLSVDETEGLSFITGNNYPCSFTEYDLIIKSPGISLYNEGFNYETSEVTSQTDLFLQLYWERVIGITGTKGKSTTSSLIYHILKTAGIDSVYGGNIGIPLFDLIDQINENTIIVCELSSHQLEFIQRAPHISVLLNIYQEHLDHYRSFTEYQQAKYNIGLKQTHNDYFIYNQSDKIITEILANSPLKSTLIGYPPADQSLIFEKERSLYLKTNNEERKIIDKDFATQLKGEHNISNAVIASICASLVGVKSNQIAHGIATFTPLEHRMEFVGCLQSKHFYNDSISTIPEATIAAIESLKPISTLILGGYDRGIDYSVLTKYLENGQVENVVTTGPAGLHLFELLSENTVINELFYYNKFDEAVLKAIEITPQNGICLLSPAASSYNEFRNFEERGSRFKQLVRDSVGT